MQLISVHLLALRADPILLLKESIKRQKMIERSLEGAFSSMIFTTAIANFSSCLV